MNRKNRSSFGFKYQKKRIKSDRRLPVLCVDYEAEDTSLFGNCKKADLCKNATYGMDGVAFGNCYGGSKSSEREFRKQIFCRRRNKIKERNKNG